MATQSTLSTAQERLENHIRSQGLRHTRQRVDILQAFFELGTHASIEEVLKGVQVRSPGIGYATIYRTMKLFVEAGIASERQFQDGQTRYEPLTPEEHHDHLICNDCHAIFEFEDPEIERRQQEAAERHGLKMISHHHEVYGTCRLQDKCPRWPHLKA